MKCTEGKNGKTYRRLARSLAVATLAVPLTGAHAGESSAKAPVEFETGGLIDESNQEFLGGLADWSSELNVGDILFPHLHVFGAFGSSTADEISDLAVNDHDPQREATLQGLEPSLSLRAGWLQGFASAAGITDSQGDFSFTLEEGFLKIIEIPFGFEVRGGQYLNRFGFQNAVHSHGWDFVDQNLVNGRFLNEGELITQGGELFWNVPLPMMQSSVISASFGGLASHGHGHEEEEHGEEAEFEAEGAEFTDFVATVTWANQYDIDDRNRFTGIFSGAWGDNEFGRSTQVYGLGFEYLWRDNGYARGGDSFRWRTEVLYRRFGAVSGHLHGEEEDEHGHEDEHEEEEHGHEDEHEEEEHGHEDEHEDEEHEDDHDDEEPRSRRTLDDVGLYTSLIYGFDDRFEAGVRAGWVSGISEAGLDDRFRLSPALTWYANSQRTLQARLQYNWDHSDDFGDEHSVWFQVGINLGGPEVR